MSNITHYGPAPTGGDSLSAIDHQSEGTLSCLVQQRTNSYVEYDERNGRFSAVYKGPTTVIRDLARQILIGSSLSDVLTIIENQISIVNRFENPLPYEGLTWLVESVKVDQNFGDHSVMTVYYHLYSNTGSGGGGGSGGTLSADPFKDTWNLKWETYTVKPYAFCKNDAHVDDDLTAFFSDSTSADAIKRYKEGYAEAEHIQQHLKSKTTSTKVVGSTPNDLSVRTYQTNLGEMKVLHLSESLILEKVARERTALYHYPILTHNTVKSTVIENVHVQDEDVVEKISVDYDEEVGGDIDHILEGDDQKKLEVPVGCPYTFDRKNHEWMWVKTGDELQKIINKERNQDKVTIEYHRTETFMGVISADENFYGNVDFDHDDLKNCRWEIGRL